MATINEKMTAIADAIRSKTGETGKLSLDAMAESINSIEGNSTNFSIIARTEQPKTGDTITYDGTMEGLVSAACEAAGDNTYAFKVSDATPTIEDFANGYVVTFPGGTNGGFTSDEYPAYTSGGKIIFAEGYGFIAPSEFTDTEGKTCPAGTYLVNFGSTTQYTTDYIAILQLPGYTGFGGEYIAENTIWVNTDTEITSWVFSPDEPENPSDGIIWFFVGTSLTAVAFNALKENNIQIYPKSAKQYVNGAWVNKTAKIYQNGAWKDWAKYIFRSGEGPLVSIVQYAYYRAGVSYTNDSLVHDGGSGSGNNYSVTSTTNTVDLNGCSMLYARAKCTSNYGEGKNLRIGLSSKCASSNFPADVNQAAVKPDIASTEFVANSIETVYSLPIPSDLTGAFIWIWGNGAGEIYDIWLE